MANLHQINVQFDPGQDRLLFRCRMDDDSEILAWLTRRYTKLLLGILDKLVVKDGADLAEKAKDSLQRDVALTNADFVSEYSQSAASCHPFGKEPVLLSGISYSLAPNGLCALALQLPDKRSINFNLNRDMLFVIIKLLSDAAGKAEWDLSVVSQQASEPPLIIPQNQVIH